MSEASNPSPNSTPSSYRSILSTVWPIVLANASTPLLGLADIAVLGRASSVEALAAVALGALVLSFVYWGFGFLRMTTTGFVAQANGADNPHGVAVALARAALMGVTLGVGIWILQTPITSISMNLLDGSHAVESIASEYLRVRIWSAPAALATFALIGTLIGLGESKRLLAVQVVINGLNITLDLLFTGALHMGAVGVALGTAIAEWIGLFLGAWFVFASLQTRWTKTTPLPNWQEILNPKELRRMFSAQLDIMARTIFLLAGFAWFTNQSARFSDTTLAANHILLQLVSFSAFILDGFAFATESLIGRALGSGRREAFDQALQRTSTLALISALILGASIAFLGPLAISALTDIPSIREETNTYLNYAGIYVCVSVVAFQLDGIFIGATQTRAMRNAALAALLIFLTLSWTLVPRFSNHGLWIAFIGYVIARAIALIIPFSSLRRSLDFTR